MAKEAKNPTTEVEVESPKTPEEIAEWIAVAAYYKAQERGFTPGNEVENWIEAEREIASKLDLNITAE